MSRELTDESAEFALLSRAFSTPADLDRPEWKSGLFSGANRDLAKALLQLRAKAQPVTPGNVRLLTKNEDLGALADKLNVRTLGGSFDMLVERLREIRIRVKLATICHDYHEAAYDEKKPIREIVEGFEEKAMTIRGVKTSNLMAGSDFGEIIEEIQWRQENVGKIRGMSTGFTRLDNLIDGLLPNYYVLGARTSVGKTAFILNIVAELLKLKKRVLFFAAENPKQIQRRLLSIIARVQMGRMDRAYTDAETKAISKAIAMIAGFDWLLDDTPAPSIAHIRATARRLHRERRLDMIVMDFIQLARATHANPGDKRAVVDEVSKGFKAMVGELGVPVVVLAQIRRLETTVDHKAKTTEEREPMLSDLKESGAIEEDSDTVWLMSRNQKDASSRAKLNVAKNKEGPTESVLMKFHPQHFYFSEE